MSDTGNAKDCLELSAINFSIFTLKNVTWRTYLISFTVQSWVKLASYEGVVEFCFLVAVFITVILLATRFIWLFWTNLALFDVVFGSRLPCKQWFLQAGRYATKEEKRLQASVCFFDE